MHPLRAAAMTLRPAAPSDSSVLDFLRTMAVCMVLVDHLVEATGNSERRWLAERPGWLRVMLFFVHTSLVLMLSLERTHATCDSSAHGCLARSDPARSHSTSSKHLESGWAVNWRSGLCIVECRVPVSL